MKELEHLRIELSGRNLIEASAGTGKTYAISCLTAELAQEAEWNHDAQLDWASLADPLHRGMQQLVADLNQFYRSEPSLHALDTDAAGFRWLIGDDCVNSVYAFYRIGFSGSSPVIAI